MKSCGRDASYETVKLVSTFEFDLSRTAEFVSLRHPDEYPIIEENWFQTKVLIYRFRNMT
jgi:hypothetical protein